MSIAEHGAPTEREVAVLMIARANGAAGFGIDGCINEAEVRVAARRLAERKLAELSIEHGGEVLRLNSAGARFLGEQAQ